MYHIIKCYVIFTIFHSITIHYIILYLYVIFFLPFSMHHYGHQLAMKMIIVVRTWKHSCCVENFIYFPFIFSILLHYCVFLFYSLKSQLLFKITILLNWLSIISQLCVGDSSHNIVSNRRKIQKKSSINSVLCKSLNSAMWNWKH